MVAPALIYLALSSTIGPATLSRGWAIPCATDIAFSAMIARVIFPSGHPAIPFLLLLAIGFGVGWVFIVLGLLIRTPMTVMTLGFTVLFPVVFASNIMVEPATMPGWLRVFVEVNPISAMTTAMRGLMAGTATPGQIGLALLAPVVLTAVLAPLTLWLYRRR